jgi:hypothetical protein
MPNLPGRSRSGDLGGPPSPSPDTHLRPRKAAALASGSGGARPVEDGGPERVRSAMLLGGWRGIGGP